MPSSYPFFRFQRDVRHRQTRVQSVNLCRLKSGGVIRILFQQRIDALTNL